MLQELSTPEALGRDEARMALGRGLSLIFQNCVDIASGKILPSALLSEEDILGRYYRANYKHLGSWKRFLQRCDCTEVEYASLCVRQATVVAKHDALVTMDVAVLSQL